LIACDGHMCKKHAPIVGARWLTNRNTEHFQTLPGISFERFPHHGENFVI